MGDMIDGFRAMKEHRRDERTASRKANTAALAAEGVEFVSKNHGAHLIIKSSEGVVDFWPSSGRWQLRSGLRPPVKGFGVDRLLSRLEVV